MPTGHIYIFKAQEFDQNCTVENGRREGVLKTTLQYVRQTMYDVKL